MRVAAIVLILVVGFFVMSHFSFLATYEDGRVRGGEYIGVLLPMPVAILAAWALHRLWKRGKDDGPHS